MQPTDGGLLAIGQKSTSYGKKKALSGSELKNKNENFTFSLGNNKVTKTSDKPRGSLNGAPFFSIVCLPCCLSPVNQEHDYYVLL